MRIQTRWWILAFVVIGHLFVVGGVLSLLGCGQKKTESQGTQQTTPPAGETADRGESGETMTPAGTVAGIWDQITAERDKLAAAIQNGQLKDVHHLAFGVRDLVVALADKTTAFAPGAAPKLKTLVDQVKASAGKLDETGDAGDLGGTQAEFAKLNAILDAVKATVSPR